MKKRILVIEDDSHIRMGLCDMLEAENYDVEKTADGLQAAAG